MYFYLKIANNYKILTFLLFFVKIMKNTAIFLFFTKNYEKYSNFLIFYKNLANLGILLKNAQLLRKYEVIATFKKIIVYN